MPELAQHGSDQLWLVAEVPGDKQARPTVVWAGMAPTTGYPCRHCASAGIHGSCSGMRVHLLAAVHTHRRHHTDAVVFGAFPISDTIRPVR